jgi:hypothetical protein
MTADVVCRAVNSSSIKSLFYYRYDDRKSKKKKRAKVHLMTRNPIILTRKSERNEYSQQQCQIANAITLTIILKQSIVYDDKTNLETWTAHQYQLKPMSMKSDIVYTQSKWYITN